MSEKNIDKSSLFVELKGSEDENNTQQRINYLSLLLNNAVENNNHIDKLRQNYLNFALLIFAGLFGFGSSLFSKTEHLFIFYIPIPLIMSVFFLLDRKLHKLSHGWSHLRKVFTKKISELINKPTEDISFYRWYPESHKYAKWYSLQSIIYFALIVGGIILIWINYKA